MSRMWDATMMESNLNQIKHCGICFRACELYYELEVDKYDGATYLQSIDFVCSPGSVVCDSCYPKMTFLYNVEWTCEWLRKERDNLVSWFTNKKLGNAHDQIPGETLAEHSEGECPNPPYDVRKLVHLFLFNELNLAGVDVGVQVNLRNDIALASSSLEVKQEIVTSQSPDYNDGGFMERNEDFCGVNQLSEQDKHDQAITIGPIDNNMNVDDPAYDLPYFERDLPPLHSKEEICDGTGYDSNNFGTDTPFVWTNSDTLRTFSMESSTAESKKYSKKHQCNICGNRFSSRSKLDCHVNAAHDAKKTFSCPVCNRRYSKKSSWKAHMSAKHHLVKNETDNPTAGKTNEEDYKIDNVVGDKHITPEDDVLSCPVEPVSDFEASGSIYNGTEDETTIQRPTIGDDNQSVELSSTISDNHKQFSCDFCHKKFNSRPKRDCHRKAAHDIEKPFCCPVCNRRYMRKCTVKTHILMMHNWSEEDAQYESYISNTGITKSEVISEAKYCCKQCMVAFRESTSLKHHMETVHDMNKLHVDEGGKKQIPSSETERLCGSCGILFSSSAEHSKDNTLCESCNFKNQAFTKSGNGFLCPICGVKCETDGISHHIMSHFPKENKQVTDCPHVYTCPTCGALFKSWSCLRSHLTVHTGIYSCPKCAKCFSAQKYLVEHYMCHTGMKPHACDFCNKTFTKRYVLRKHIRSVHPGQKSQSENIYLEESKSTCEGCGASFSEMDALVQHQIDCEAYKSGKKILSHKSTVTNLCPVCGEFCEKLGLKRHMERHGGNWTRKFRCHLCEKWFTSSSGLRYHLESLIHTSVKNHTCDQCGKTFANKYGLGQHKRLHDGTRTRYHCLTCGKSFTQRDNLKDHQTVHSGEQPYECSECGTKFSYKTALKRHMSMHSVDGHRKHHCNICFKSFTRPEYLKDHILRQHKKRDLH